MPVGTQRIPYIQLRPATTFNLAICPTAKAGRWVYSGGFTWVIPETTREVHVFPTLLALLSDPESQRIEADQGILVSRVSVNDESRRSALPSTHDARRLVILNETIQSSLLLPPTLYCLSSGGGSGVAYSPASGDGRAGGL